jgi:hypothetical protein
MSKTIESTVVLRSIAEFLHLCGALHELSVRRFASPARRMSVHLIAKETDEIRDNGSYVVAADPRIGSPQLTQMVSPGLVGEPQLPQNRI